MSQVIREKKFTNSKKLQLAQGDITTEKVDAIVNAANSELMHGGGVAGAISRKGGPLIQQESDAWVRKHGPVSHGEPAFTGAGSLPSKYVIHAVGPVWGEGDEDAKLAAAITGSLRLAEKLELHSVALTAISTGIFGFPKERAAQIIFREVDRWFQEHAETGLEVVRITIIDRPTMEAFTQAFDGLAL